jgi:hypothetical protein
MNDPGAFSFATAAYGRYGSHRASGAPTVETKMDRVLFSPVVVIMACFHAPVPITCPVRMYVRSTVPTSGWAGSRCIPTVLLLLVGGGENENLPCSSPILSSFNNSLPFPCGSCSRTDVLNLPLCDQDGPSSSFVGGGRLLHQILTTCRGSSCDFFALSTTDQFACLPVLLYSLSLELF